jgi:hypothetical protein
MKSATPLNNIGPINWGDYLGRKISTVVSNTTSNAGGADYVITNVNPGNLSTLVGGIWQGRNHDLGGGFYAKHSCSAVFFEQCGTTNAVDSVTAMQSALDSSDIVYFASTVTFANDIWLRDGQTLRGVGHRATLRPTSNARIRCEKGAGFRSFDNTAQYYNETVAAGTPMSLITANVSVDSYTVTVASTTGFAEGDLVFIFNGYCDHWRQLEQGSDPSVWNVDGNDFAAGEVMTVRALTSTTLTFEQPTFYAYPVAPVLYGGLSGENAQASYVGFNTPRVTKLVGSENLTVRDFSIDDSANAGAGFYKECVSFDQIKKSKISNIAIYGGRGILLSNKACYNTLTNISVDSKISNGVRLESFCCHNNISDLNLKFKEGGDSALLLNLRACHNNINNVTVDGYYSTNINSIGAYLNGSYNNNINNITVRNCHGGVAAYFDSFDNNVSNVTGHCVGNILISYISRRTTWNGFKQTGYMDDAFGAQEKTNILAFSCKQDNFANGDIRSNAFLAIKMEYTQDCVIDNVRLEGQDIGVRVKGATQNAATEIKYCNIDSTNTAISIVHDSPDDASVKAINIHHNKKLKAPRAIALNDVKFVLIEDNPHIESTSKSIELDYSSFYKIRRNKFFGGGSSVGIDFEGSLNSKFLSSHGLVDDNEFNNCTSKFASYTLPALDKAGASSGTRFIDLTSWPINREFVYISDTPNLLTAAAWVTISSYMQITTTAALNSAANTINTNGKFKGKLAYDDTLDTISVASGAVSTDVWKSADGSTVNTPV